jgi:hypothetical protein
MEPPDGVERLRPTRNALVVERQATDRVVEGNGIALPGERPCATGRAEGDACGVGRRTTRRNVTLSSAREREQNVPTGSTD